MSFALTLKTRLLDRKSNESLMLRYAQSGDRTLLTRLYDTCGNDLYHFVVTLSDQTLAKDICQKTWLKVIQKKCTWKLSKLKKKYSRLNNESTAEVVCMEQLVPGVLTKSNTEKGGWLTDSVPMSTRRQPSNPRLRLGLLGCHLVDIGMKLHSVHFSVKFSSADLRWNCTRCTFAVKFSSASAAPRLRRTWLQSAPRAISSQVGLSPTKSA